MNRMDLSEYRILHVITRSDWGGAPRVVKLLAERTNADVAVACGGEGRLIEELEKLGITVFNFPYLESEPRLFSDIKSFQSLFKVLKKESFDLVHCHSTKAGLIGRLSAVALNIPTIFTVHGWGFYNTEYDRLAPVITLGERLLARVTNQIVCVSNNDLDQGKYHGITQHTRSKVIHNGVPPLSLENPRTNLADICPIDPDKPVIGAIARLAPQKNPLSILRTAKKLRDQGYNTQTVLIGKGSLMRKCEKYVQKNNLVDVHLLGFREDALEILPDLDVFLLPSEFEGFPLTILESLHAGVPLVAYDVGGVSEAIENGYTGYVVPKGEHEMFVESVIDVIYNENVNGEMSTNARKIAHEKFTADRMASEYDQVYKQVLEENNF